MYSDVLESIHPGTQLVRILPRFNTENESHSVRIETHAIEHFYTHVFTPTSARLQTHSRSHTHIHTHELTLTQCTKNFPFKGRTADVLSVSFPQSLIVMCGCL